MKTEQDYIKDISEIRLMMERSTKFFSLTGLSGILAGVYALIGAYLANQWLNIDPDALMDETLYAPNFSDMISLFLLAVSILILAMGTSMYLSYRKATKDNEVLWNPTARRLLLNMAIPLVTGGIFILILLSKGIIGLIAPLSLIFYGLALFNASRFTFSEVKYLGIAEISLGLISSYFIGFGLIFWAIGFGFMHIAYGVYMHVKYER